MAAVMATVRRRFSVIEVKGGHKNLLLVTSDPMAALDAAQTSRTRAGPFYRIEVRNERNALVLDDELRLIAREANTGSS